ncbi:MAG: helix-turn-helix domain-containing protein [Mycobacterium sp.]
MTSGQGSRPAETVQDARVARTRSDVARAALEVLTQEGSDAVTHAKIAEVAGYSKTTLYAHWPARLDLIAVALDGIGEMPHHERSGDLRTDLIGELTVFRQAVIEMHLDRLLAGMAQWASAEEMRLIRDKINSDGQRPLRTMLAESFDGYQLEAAVSMLSGVVACPSIMFGKLPDDGTISAAVDIVLASRRNRS